MGGFALDPTRLSMGLGYGAPVNPDGSYQRSDGTIDWAVGTGPQYNWGGEDRKTGQPPISPAPPEPDSVADRGTPEWRQAFNEHEAWIQQNRAAGRTLADLGMAPHKGGGLSAYMRYANTPRGNATAAPGAPATPNPANTAQLRGGIAGGPRGLRTPIPQPSTPITGGGSILAPSMGLMKSSPSTAPAGSTLMQPGGNMFGGGSEIPGRVGGTMPRNSTGLFPNNPFPMMGSPVLGGGFMSNLRTRLGAAKGPTPYGGTARAF